MKVKNDGAFYALQGVPGRLELGTVLRRGQAVRSSRREFLRPAEVEECRQLLRLLGRGDHDDGLAALHEGDEVEAAPAALFQRPSADPPWTTLELGGRRPAGQYL